MQWSPDRNAGFSSADPGKLYLPVIDSLVYNRHAVNVESQMATSSSLLHWIKAMLEVRRQHPVFGLGDFTFVGNDNDTILSFVRGSVDGEDEAVLCVNNVSSRPQAVHLRLPDSFAGAQLYDLFGGTGFPAVGEDGSLTLTLGSRDFFWLQLRRETTRG
jgi:maltose alpha-D-glucosyltransferase/alpha-amylase